MLQVGHLVSVPGPNTKHCQMSTITMTIDNWWLWIYEFWRVIKRSRRWACQMVWHLSRGHSRSAWSDAVDDGGTVARSWWTPQLPAGSQVGIKHPAPGVVKKAQGFNAQFAQLSLGIAPENFQRMWWKCGFLEEVEKSGTVRSWNVSRVFGDSGELPFLHFCPRRLVSLTRSLPRARRRILHVQVLMGNLVMVEASFVHISWGFQVR